MVKSNSIIVPETSRQKALDTPKTFLSVQGLYKSFGALKATNGVNLDLFEGEIHALIGPNGAGKSTLLAQLCGELKPDSGKIYIKGQDVTNDHS